MEVSSTYLSFPQVIGIRPDLNRECRVVVIFRDKRRIRSRYTDEMVVKIRKYQVKNTISGVPDQVGLVEASKCHKVKQSIYRVIKVSYRRFNTV